MNDLFPTQLKEAARRRHHERRMTGVLSQMWLEENDPDGETQRFVISWIKQRGPCALDIRLIQEFESLGLKGEERWDAWSRCFHVALCMVTTGKLWKHEYAQDILIFGIRKRQPKRDYLNRLREARP